MFEPALFPDLLSIEMNVRSFKQDVVKQEDIDTSFNFEGIPLFPNFDHSEISVKQIARIIDSYLTSLWGETLSSLT